MGCCGDRNKKPPSEEQKWSYITLEDFRAKSCLTPFSYFWVWILIFTYVGIIGADTFTAVQLLVFDRWSSEVKPVIPFRISKWIFAGCIIASFVIIIYELIRMIVVVRRDGVADSYLDPLAVLYQSARLGSGRGWRRFLIFAELTKSKKGTDYVALFVYFQFKGALAIILAEGPRVVINAMTLYSVFRIYLLPGGTNVPKSHASGISQFWQNLEVLARKDRKQVIILCSMLYTLVIWVVSVLLLFSALILYLVFLWHYIPSQDGSLSKYLRRKIDGRLAGIVSKTTRKALEKEEMQRRKDERKAAKAGDYLKKPTLPDFDDTASMMSSDTLLSKPSLARTDTSLTAGSFATSRFSRAPKLPDIPPIDELPPPRTGTEAFGNSYASNLSLHSNPGFDGQPDRLLSNSPAGFRPGPPGRSMTRSPLRSHGSGPGPSPAASYNPNGPLMRPPMPQSCAGPSPGPGVLHRVETAGSMSSIYSGGTLVSRSGGSPLYNDPRRSPPGNGNRMGPSFEMNPVRTSPPGGIPNYTQRPDARDVSGGSSFGGPTLRYGTTATDPGSGGRQTPRAMPNRGLNASPASDSGVGYGTRNFSSSAIAQPRSNEAPGFGGNGLPPPPQRSFTSPSMPTLQDTPTGRSHTAGPTFGNGGSNYGRW